MNNIYLGPKYSDSEIKKQFIKIERKIIGFENITNQQVAKYLALGLVGARFSERMEFARALGNRSIIADPSKIEVLKRLINK